MASWFYLYLYTESAKRYTEDISVEVTKEANRTATMNKITNKSAIKKGITNMSVNSSSKNDIYIDEATSHWLNVTVLDEDGTAMDLTGCSAIFTAGIVEKACDIEDNVIHVKLEPEETEGYISSGYQIRVFDANDDVFQIIQGIIYIRKAHKPYTQNPLGGE